MSEENNKQENQPQPKAQSAAKSEFELPRVVTLETLEALPEVGKVKAEKMYHKIAAAGGFGDFKKDAWAKGLPALSLDGLPAENRAAIAKILQEK